MDNQYNGLVRPGKSAPRGADRRVSFNLNKFISSLNDAFAPGNGESDSVAGRDGLLHKTPLTFAREYLFEQILSKFSDGKSSDLLVKEALRRFDVAEASCQLHNQKFRTLIGLYGPWTREINLARNLLWDLFGPVVDLNEVSKHFGFGPGASTRLKRRNGDSSFKYSGNPESTLNNLPYAEAAISSIPLWRLNTNAIRPTTISIVAGSRIDTVPKNSKTDRVIAIEPDMNMYIQKGFGKFIRSRLRRWNIDLNTQANNQEYAQRAFLEGYATIDLSMASDTISQGIVETLCPPDLFSHLNQCRSWSYVHASGAGPFLFQKFSSMGNGVTFELETAIFASLAKAVAITQNAEEHRVLVYGDDIIVHQSIAPRLINLLSYCGFNTNEDKTFVGGAFYESCGKHFYEGHDVTPFFIRRPVDTVQELMLLHNNLYRYVNRIWHLVPLENLKKFRELLATLRHMCHAKWRRLVIPDGFGDGGFVRDVPDLVLRRNRDGHFTYEFRHLVNRPSIVKHEGHGLLIKALGRIARKESEESNIFPTLDDGKTITTTLNVPIDHEALTFRPSFEWFISHYKEI